MRHDVTFPLYRRGRRDLQSRLPGLADPLPARPRADDQDLASTARSTCWAWPSASTRKILQASTSEVYGDPAVHPQTRGLLGQRQSDRHPLLLRRGQALRRDAVLRLSPPAPGCAIKVARIFNTYGPRMHPTDGRVVSNFIVQALRNEPITIYGDGSQTRSFCYVDDLIDGLMRADGHAPETSPARSTSAIRANSPSASSPRRSSS